MQEHEPSTSGPLPIISKATINKLERELGLDISADIKEVLQGITKEKEVSPEEKIRGTSYEVFNDVASVNPEFVKAIRQGIVYGTAGENIYLFARSCLLDGMALVIKAFHIESECNLIKRFKDIGDNDLRRVTDIIKTSLRAGKELDKIESALLLPRIPDPQVDLKDLIEKASGEVSFRDRFKLGGSAMFALLSEFKSKLFPNPTSLEQQFPST